jgi:hypothetical protein
MICACGLYRALEHYRLVCAVCTVLWNTTDLCVRSVLCSETLQTCVCGLYCAPKHYRLVCAVCTLEHYRLTKARTSAAATSSFKTQTEYTGDTLSLFRLWDKCDVIRIWC